MSINFTLKTLFESIKSDDVVTSNRLVQKSSLQVKLPLKKNK